jgi:hypothetical protein
VCDNATVALVASGGGSYVWSDGETTQTIIVQPHGNTIYSVTATTSSNGVNCSASQTIQVYVIPDPIVTAGTTRSLVCVGESNTITASGAQSYSWSNGATGPAIVVTAPSGSSVHYTVTGTGANGCTDTYVVHLQTSACSGLSENNIVTPELEVFPNPSHGSFTFKSNEKLSFSIINSLGQEVGKVNLTSGNGFTETVSGLAQGFYMAYNTMSRHILARKLSVD